MVGVKMRQIKFRGKTVDGRKWVHGYYYYNGSHVIIDSDYIQCVIDPETLGQFVGICDVNNTEIYEGDILKIHQFLFDGVEIEMEHIGVVTYKSGDAAFHFDKIKGKFWEEHTGFKSFEEGAPICNFYGLHEESFKIIGNRHDNPELMGVER
jgi:uncharacterized phage protein (TIGR01671 family)